MTMDVIESGTSLNLSTLQDMYENELAEVPTSEEASFSPHSTDQVLDYNSADNRDYALDYALTGTNWDEGKNILATYSDGKGSIINGFF